ncbi:HNH endonuclease [Vibrio parahaemolyticus]|nr:HNH endonuclease [Vibrio parahaemolyticus]
MRKLCTYPCCRNITTGGTTRCDKHKSKNKRSAVATERAAFYNTQRWRNFSRLLRQSRPICELCNRNLTSDVDHWLEISADKNHEYTFDERNMVCVCKACHNAKGRKIYRYLQNEDYQKLYQWLVSSHPRQDCVSYLHDWRKSQVEEAKKISKEN